MSRLPETVTITSDEGGVPSASCALHLVLEAARPAAGGERWDLSDLEAIVVGRGDARTAHVDTEGKTLTLAVADPRMSSRHARLVRLAGGWVVEDLGSKNGTRLDGKLVERARVPDSAWLELGGTFFQWVEHPAPFVFPEAMRDVGLWTSYAGVAKEYARLVSVAHSSVPLLLLGESGTGKELAARAAHDLSKRTGRFIAVNCGSLPITLIESELFGHRRGSFSGATEDRIGLVRSADKGTLFLDEIGDMPLGVQASLLRVLQERTVTPVGETHALPVDLRVVAATHRDLDDCVATGRFRGDLLARIDGHRVVLLPLRARRADLGSLIAALLQRLAPDRARNVQLSGPAARALLRYEWPRNIRELEHALGAALSLAQGRPIGLSDLPAALQRDQPSPHPRPTDSESDERALTEEDRLLKGRLTAALEQHRGNLAGVARELSKDRTQIRRWLARLGIDPGPYR